MNASTSSSYSPFSTSPSSRHNSNIDRDVLAQRALLGEDAYNSSELESPSPLATPSPMIKQLSPLTVASHLQDNMLLNPFLDDYDTARKPYSAVAPHSHHSSVKTDAVPKRSSRRSPSSAMTSGLGLDLTEEQDRVSAHSNGQTRITRQQQSDQPAIVTLLPIQEDSINRSSPPTSRRRTNKPAILNSYSLPPSTEMSSPSSTTSSATWRRPSVFPLGPVPPPLPPRRARYEPPPHIVDVAVERFNINTRTISSPATTPSSSPSSALEQERQRQWQQWEAERVRSLEMTREAAKNNRVQAPSSSSSNRTTTTTTTAVSEVKPSSIHNKKSKSKWWWCFGGGAVETDEEVVDEKKFNRQSVASLDAIDVEEDAEDEEEWNEARVATGLLSSFTFSCSKSNNTRPRATLKKKTY